MSTPAAQEGINAYWSGHGADYDDHPTSRLHMGDGSGAWRDVWASALPPAPSEVLDVGTGTGQVAVHLWELGHRVTGVDLAEGMLELARAKAIGPGAPDFLVRDAVDPDLPVGSFDAVTARYLLWTLREPVAALRAWRALLRPGGRLAVVDGLWFRDGIGQRADGHDSDEFHTAYRPEVVDVLPLAESRSRDAFVEVVRAAGFGDVQVRSLPGIRAIEVALAGDEEIGDRVDVVDQFLITATTR